MEMLQEYLGQGTNLTVSQMCLRAAIVFFIALIFIRIGRRAFGMGSPFDNVISILLGAILSRAVVGASPFTATLAAAVVIIFIHKTLAWLSLHFSWLGKIVKGEAKLIYKEGKMVEDTMNKFFISENDFKESLRHECKTDDLSEICEAYVERDGRISIIKRRKD